MSLNTTNPITAAKTCRSEPKSRHSPRKLGAATTVIKVPLSVTPVRIVCANTETAAIGRAQASFGISHTGGPGRAAGGPADAQTELALRRGVRDRISPAVRPGDEPRRNAAIRSTVGRRRGGRQRHQRPQSPRPSLRDRQVVDLLPHHRADRGNAGLPTTR